MLKNIFFWKELSSEQKKKILLRPNNNKKKNFEKSVTDILLDVKQSGDLALKKYTLIFDKKKINNFKITKENILNAISKVNVNLKHAILHAKKNIEIFHKLQIQQNINIETQPGVRCECIFVPIDTVGLYIPGGTAPLVSTVLMLAIPAMIAGCKKIVLCSPPPISNEILYASYICGIKEIYQVGGAQAIAAMAFGTDSIPKVKKIFGPGNAFVTEAKRQVSTMLEGSNIDILAGPSEVLVIADEWSNCDFIASDLLSQSEHGIDSQSIFLTPSYLMIKKVIASISNQLKNISKLAVINQSLENSRFIILKDLDECVKISNFYAPEHLIIQTKYPRKLLDKVTSAGSIFLGEWSPESAGDYASGSNHVLPTNGYASRCSGLKLYDFQKSISVQELTKKGLMNLSKTILEIASVENMEAHKNSVLIRIKKLEKKYEFKD